MDIKPVRPLCYMFLYTWRCTTFKNISIILIVQINKRVALIYSVTIWQHKAKDCALSGCFQHKLQQCCFYYWCLPLFITILLWTMVYIYLRISRVAPSTLHPNSEKQTKEPSVLIQDASCEQLWAPVAHSSTSEKQKRRKWKRELTLPNLKWHDSIA